jgi:hypothetical protein
MRNERHSLAAQTVNKEKPSGSSPAGGRLALAADQGARFP